MKKYIKPFIEDEELEIEDICFSSSEDIGQKALNGELDENNEDSSPWPWS